MDRLLDWIMPGVLLGGAWLATALYSIASAPTFGAGLRAVLVRWGLA